jgi:bacteriocin-like protein
MSNKLEITDTLIKTGTKADDELTEQKLNKVSGGIINYKEFKRPSRPCYELLGL